MSTTWPLFPTSCPSLYGTRSSDKESSSSSVVENKNGDKSGTAPLDVDVSFDE